MRTLPTSLGYSESGSSSIHFDHNEKVDLHGWGFTTLLLVIGSLFIRPTDLLPQLRDAPVYQFIIVVAMLFSYRAIANQLSQHQLTFRPVTACVLLLIAAVACSHLANGFFWGARDSAWKVVKLVVLYLLIVGLVNTKRRLRIIASWLVLAITLMSFLALMDIFGWIDLTAFAPIEDRIVLEGEKDAKLSRIQGSGIFEDPNDLGLAVVIGLSLLPYFILKPKIGWLRYVWLVPGAILTCTLVLTYSRGAFLALAATIPAWHFYHRGWKSAITRSAIALPILVFVFSGRMTEYNSVYEGTGQSRIQIWSESLSLFRAFPFFGIGEGMFFERIGIVCHNSFLQSFAELGFLGGTLFIAVFLTAIACLLPNHSFAQETGAIKTEIAENEDDDDGYRLRGVVFVVLVGYATGMLFLSRQFLTPTFMVLGLAVAAQQCSQVSIPKSWHMGTGLAIRAFVVALVFLGLIYLAIQLFIRTR